MDLTKLSDAQLNTLTRNIAAEKLRRKRLVPGFYAVNLEKSLLKTYNQYKNTYRPYVNPALDMYQITGWTFDQFKAFLVPHLDNENLDAPVLLKFGYWIDLEIKRRTNEWKKNNDPNYGKNGFCKQCDRYYVGELCNGKHL